MFKKGKASSHRLDPPEEGEPEEEVHYTGRDIEEVIRKLCTVAMPRTQIITEAEVRSEHRELSEAWGNLALLRGTLK